MAGAYISFLQFAGHNPDILKQFSAATDLALPAMATSPLEQMIDRATGFDQISEDFAVRFVVWVTENYWGIDDAPSVYYELIRMMKKEKNVRVPRRW